MQDSFFEDTGKDVGLVKYAVSAQEMEQYDQYTISKIGIPALVLMERAAVETVRALTEQKKVMGKRVLVLSGTGNNGGDGLAVGRMLADLGAKVTFTLFGSREKLSKETEAQIRILENLGFPIQSKLEDGEYDIIVDALFGIGLSRPLEGKYSELVSAVNHMHQMGAYVCSVDIPSGICADTGKVMGCAVQADLTVAFAFAKRGELLYPGRSYTGKLAVRDIGIPIQAMEGSSTGAFFYERKDLAERMPERKLDGNKGTFGKVLLIAGSHDLCGACVLSGSSILRTGAGMVKIIAPECNREIIQTSLPEAMLYSYQEIPEKTEVEKALDWADAVVIGPGLGTGEAAHALLGIVLTYRQIPMLLDADALNMIVKSPELATLLQCAGKRAVLTPHPGELIRLLGTDKKRYHEERMALIQEVLQKFNCVLAAKDAATIVARADKDEIFINTSGNDGMATAGSGDVLSGIIGALLAQHMSCFDAACLGVFLHGMAGDAAAKSYGKYSMTAGDLVKQLPVIFGNDLVQEEGNDWL